MTAGPEHPAALPDLLGSGEFSYQVSERWGRLPEGWDLGDVGGVAVDDEDNVYVFNRGPHPMLVFDRNGSFVRSWGEGLFSRPHGVSIGPDATIYCADDGDHTVRRCTLHGEVLMTIGTSGSGSSFMSGLPFCRCTHSALAPNGDIYISDGYGNARIHKYSPDGRLLMSWGAPGCSPGEFNLPHNIVCDSDGWVYVVDRENHRVQVFGENGKYETEWRNLHRPSALCLAGPSASVFYVSEIGPYYPWSRGTPNLGPRLSILDRSGGVIARLQSEPAAGTGARQFLSPHGIAVDSHGDIYVGEVSAAAWPSLFPGESPAEPLPRLRKLVKVPRDNQDSRADGQAPHPPERRSSR